MELSKGTQRQGPQSMGPMTRDPWKEVGTRSLQWVVECAGIFGCIRSPASAPTVHASCVSYQSINVNPANLRSQPFTAWGSTGFLFSQQTITSPSPVTNVLGLFCFSQASGVPQPVRVLASLPRTVRYT